MLKVLKFSAVWCGPCQALKPAFEQVKSQVTDVTFIDVDVDTDSTSTIKYNVSSVPTIIIEKNGQEVSRIKGAIPAATLVSVINSNK
jgi:thioredoxin 1